MHQTRRFCEALRAASDALSAAAAAIREETRADSLRDCDACCCETHCHHLGSERCPRCGGYVERGRIRCDEEREEGQDVSREEHADADGSCNAQSAPLPPYPPYPPMPPHAPMPPYPPFPPYPPYIIIVPGSGCSGQGGAAAGIPSIVFPGTPQSSTATFAGGTPHTTVTNPSDGTAGAAANPFGLDIAPSFPNPASLTDVDALLDLAERAVAAVHDLVPLNVNSKESSDA